jgi:hypothetical protein
MDWDQENGFDYNRSSDSIRATLSILQTLDPSLLPHHHHFFCFDQDASLIDRNGDVINLQVLMPGLYAVLIHNIGRMAKTEKLA